VRKAGLSEQFMGGARSIPQRFFAEHGVSPGGGAHGDAILKAETAPSIVARTEKGSFTGHFGARFKGLTTKARRTQRSTKECQERTIQPATKPMLSDIRLSSPWCVFVSFVPWWLVLLTRSGGSLTRGCFVSYAMSAFTTCPCTSVSRKSRPAWR
jgi:hypothetical protein